MSERIIKKLKIKPFCLKDEDMSWVINTFNKLSLEEKVGQILFPLGSSDRTQLEKMIKEIKPGGILFRPREGRNIQEIHRFVQDISEIPLFIAANLESGGNGVVLDGTYFGNAMQISATNNEEFAYKLGLVSGREGSAVGVNLSFSPVVDLDINFRNPITNTRTFGDDPELVIRMAKNFILGLKENGIGVTIKHFPGDGVDERDQHLVTSVNYLSPEEWDNTYGKIYKELIEFGIDAIMVGHISLPKYIEMFNQNLKDEELIPSTLSSDILKNLLRDKLGFNGLIITDATTMLGFMGVEKREIALPKAINSGCDMILFNVNIYEDYSYILDSVKRGIVTQERLNEAVLRILALKASLNLHRKKMEDKLVPDEKALSVLRCYEHEKWAKECADNAITLVRDGQNLLPISPRKYKKIKLYFIEDKNIGINDSRNFNFKDHIITYLRNEGFEVFCYEGNNNDINEVLYGSVSDIKKKYDLFIYIANIETASFKTSLRINWDGPLAFNAPRWSKEIPTIFISLSNPYHLFDVPMIETYINAYSCNKYVIESLLEKLLGRSEFKGKSPVNLNKIFQK